MIKKTLLTAFAIVAVIAGVSGMSAFEAHVINVTAHITSSLETSTTPLAFGTVFPQEYLEKSFKIGLSESANGTDNGIDNIKYVIKQKMKPCTVHKVSCGPACEQLVPDDPTCVADDPTANPPAVPDNPTGWHYQDLCKFLSKTNSDTDGTVNQNDTSHPSYFVDNAPVGPSPNDFCQTPGLDATGALSKSLGDTEDVWVIDLKVPPVVGFVGQDWPDSCVASNYMVSQDSQTYGCDLLIQTTDVGTTPTPSPSPSPTPGV